MELVKSIIDFVYRVMRYSYYTGSNVKKINKNYIVEYTLHGNTYKFIIPYKSHPIFYDITSIYGLKPMSDDLLDETTSVLPFLGPSYDCHMLNITPDMLGYEKLVIHYTGDNIQTFEKNERINIDSRCNE